VKLLAEALCRKPTGPKHLVAKSDVEFSYHEIVRIRGCVSKAQGPMSCGSKNLSTEAEYFPYSRMGFSAYGFSRLWAAPASERRCQLQPNVLSMTMQQKSNEQM
jgi:hypothetical protein